MFNIKSHVKENSWNALTPSYIFAADDEKEDSGTIDPHEIIEYLVVKYDMS